MKGHVRPARDKNGNIIKGVYDVVLDIGVDPYTGKRKQKWKRIHGYKEAHQYKRDRIRELEQGVYIADDKMTFGEFALRWLENYAKGKRNSTYESYEMLVKSHFIPAFGHLRLRNINAEVLNNYYQEKLKNGRLDRTGKPTGEPLSPSTVNYHHRVLRRMLKSAVKANLIPRNPTEDAEPPPKNANPRRHFLTSKEARRFLEVARESNSRYYTLYLAAVTTGMRAGELLGWRWSDIDLDRASARVIQTLEKAGREPVFGITKSNAGRHILLVPELVEALRQWKRVVDEERIMLGEKYRDYDLVFTVPGGAPIHDGNLARRDYKPLLEKAGLPPIRFHDLRHSAASILLEMGVHPKIVAEMLGHSQINITMDIYSHAIPGLQKVAVEKMEEALFGDYATRLINVHGIAEKTGLDVQDVLTCLKAFESAGLIDPKRLSKVTESRAATSRPRTHNRPPWLGLHNHRASRLT